MEDNAGESFLENVTVQKKRYREDTLFQLKIELDTSVDTNNKFTLTNDILNKKGYKGKPLDKYPYFAPYKIYRRGKIQRMTLLERIELFFNRQRFEQVIFGKKSRTRRKQARQKAVERNDEYEELKESNFVFTVKMLFSTAFPIVDNFSMSSDYFTSTMNKMLSFKGINLEFFPILSGKFDKKFSYLMINNEVHTVTQVIWVNDVFNHPLYNRVVDNFRKIKDDMDNLEIRSQVLNRRKRELMILVLEIDENPDDDKKKKKTKNFGSEWKTITNKLKTIVDQSGDSKYNLGESRNRQREINSMLKSFNAKIDASKTSAMAALETIRNGLNENQKAAYNNATQEQKEQYTQKYFANAHQELSTTADTVFDELGNLIEYIRIDLARASYLSPDSKQYLTMIERMYEDIRIMGLALQYIRDFEFQFLRESDDDRKKIRQKIKDIFPRASEFSEQLASFAQNRRLGNLHWNKLVQGRQINANIKAIFESLSQCYINEDCDISTDAGQYVKVELDELTRERPADAKVEMFEAYLQLNVVEGEVTRENYNKIKCRYLDEELDNMLDNFVNPQDDWNVQNEKNYFSIKDLVVKANEEIEEKKRNKTSKRQRNNNPSSDVSPPSRKKGKKATNTNDKPLKKRKKSRDQK